MVAAKQALVRLDRLDPLENKVKKVRALLTFGKKSLESRTLHPSYSCQACAVQMEPADPLVHRVSVVPMVLKVSVVPMVLKVSVVQMVLKVLKVSVVLMVLRVSVVPMVLKVLKV
jgi:hypothetical protein